MGSSKDSISWSTLMNGYAQISETGMVVDLFCGMRRCGVVTNPATIVCLLSVVEPGEGEAIHGFCVKSGILLYLNAVTAIASMYVRFERVEDARVVFDETPRRDAVTYNCIVDGYAKRGDFDECLRLLRLMRHERVRMNSSTFVGLLAACASSGALAVGHKVIEIVRAENLDLDTSLGTAILDMYVKCGYINESIEVFNKMNNRDVMAWTAMIMGLGIHGRAQDALDLFREMEEEGLTPNEVTFLAVLNACSHGGMTDLSKEFLKKMIIDYKITPSIKHYGCVIDSLARAGLLEEAYELINNLPLEGDAMAWRALLAACRVHGEVRIGQIARGALMDLGDLHPTDSILLSRTYASSEKWEDVGRMREMEVEKMKRMEKKEAGCSLIEMSR
ncbi:pentatricopeptide repeat-containing protein At1g26900, mitochondrial [Asparagus officinalis]|nr:pentatricopeptide repeat-containing protein At1g26900, mitochondrial [Asparagus officinalis]